MKFNIGDTVEFDVTLIPERDMDYRTHVGKTLRLHPHLTIIGYDAIRQQYKVAEVEGGWSGCYWKLVEGATPTREPNPFDELR